MATARNGDRSASEAITMELLVVRALHQTPRVAWLRSDGAELCALDDALADLHRLNLSRSGPSPRTCAQCRDFQGPTSEFDLQAHDFLHVKQRFGVPFRIIDR